MFFDNRLLDVLAARLCLRRCALFDRLDGCGFVGLNSFSKDDKFDFCDDNRLRSLLGRSGAEASGKRFCQDVGSRGRVLFLFQFLRCVFSAASGGASYLRSAVLFD